MTTAVHCLDRNLPKFSVDQIKLIVADLYGIAGDFRQQNAERDLSYRVRTDGGNAYVLKVSNVADAEGIIDFQIKALDHIAKFDPELPVPAVIHSRNGKGFEWVVDDSGNRHMIRLLTFMEGDVLEQVKDDCLSRTYYNLGATIAQMDLALRNFFHTDANSNLHLWDLSRCLSLKDKTHFITDTQTRHLCDKILGDVESDVLPRLSRTRHQVIHQDAHAGNVLVATDDHTRIAGIIDFGDMLYGSIVSELVPLADSYHEDESDPLQLLCDVSAGFDSVLPLEEDEIDLVYDMALLRIVMNNVIISAREAILKEGESVHLENTGLYPRILKIMVDIGPREANRRLREACRFPVYNARKQSTEVSIGDQNALLEKREKNLGKLFHFYHQPLNFTRGQGAWLYTADGTGYLDTYNNVPQIGHSHPHVVKAIARQAGALNTNTRYMCDVVADYAARLTESLPEHLNACVFVNSGSEANDFAMQFAKFASGNTGALVIQDAYHGCTETSGHLSPEIYSSADYVECLLVPDMYRGPFCDELNAAELYANDADRAIAALAGRGHKPAAFVVDTALCSNGVPTAPNTYFDLVAQKVQRAGGLVIADEVQSGLGRMGQFWGFKAVGLEHVDMITMGKPVGNGHPLGVIILNKALLDRFHEEVELFSTFGGNTVSCAAGMAVLDVIERDDLVNKGNRIGDYFRVGLRKLAERQPLIGDVRGRGMLIGLEFVTNRETKNPATRQTAELLEIMKINHVLIGSEGPFKNILKMRPSLAWNEAEVDIFIRALDNSLSALSSQAPDSND